jgi:ribonuclease D
MNPQRKNAPMADESASVLRANTDKVASPDRDAAEESAPAAAKAMPAAAFKMVARQADLGALLEALRPGPLVALDTEADSLHHYHEKVCLIQLTVRSRDKDDEKDRHWIVDPLAEGLDLTPLLARLAECPLLLHGADYDLRLLRRAYDFRPARLVDTMIASQLLGWPEVGLAAVVERVCGVALSKHAQRADWSERPLADDLLAYAVDDTRYLHRVAEAQHDELERLGRSAWLEETVGRLLETTAAEPPPSAREDADAWRIRGGRHLRGRPAALLRELWHWREEIARHIDRPPFRVAANALLLEWAGWVEKDPEVEASQMPERPRWLRGRRLQSFESSVRQALQLPPDRWPAAPPKPPRQRRPTPEEEALLKALLKARDAEAERLGIQPGVLGPREALRPLIRAPRPADAEALGVQTGLMRWQAECLAGTLLPLLENGSDR